jgi:ATPase family associated with various cellular activities (AAA)
MDFRELADLRLLLRDLLGRQIESLSLYYDKLSGGFFHRHDKPTPGRFSKSSTATCVLSLLATNEWDNGPWKEKKGQLVQGLLKESWQSAGLEVNNAFTVGFILEAVTGLLENDPPPLDDGSNARIREAEEILLKGAADGALSVQGYPPSAYVTQLVVRTLKKRNVLDAERVAKISDWAEREINKQVALLTRNEKTADVFQLAYSAILLANLVEPDRLTPDQEFILETALTEIFAKQRGDGTWPLSRPLFHYPNVGSAHCYDYEMLVQLLSEARLSEKLLRFIPNLATSARALRTLFPLGTRGAGWSSGHHPQFKGPESWSTASVYHFAHVFERLIAEQVRRETFAYLGSRYVPPQRPDKYSEELRPDFLDCDVSLDGEARSLREVVSTYILKPLVAEESRKTIESGRALSKQTPMSMIFFGPPGTSKTKLTEHIAGSLGWPLLSVDASQFLKNGMDGVYAEADRIFGMLAVAERILVLLDEFDEMVRARESATDVLSRFLTTAMLPKLHKINDNRRLVFVVATNHIEAFDVAIRRPGRFDIILQIMPPNVDRKLEKWPDLPRLVSGIDINKLKDRIKPLTFAETETLARRLRAAPAGEPRLALLEATHSKCTLLSKTNPDDETDSAKTWKDVCEEQSRLSRVS